MQLSPITNYALKLSLTQGGGGASSLLRKAMAEKHTARSAVVLATFGISLSLFSLKQMVSTQANHRFHRYH